MRRPRRLHRHIDGETLAAEDLPRNRDGFQPQARVSDGRPAPPYRSECPAAAPARWRAPRCPDSRCRRRSAAAAAPCPRAATPRRRGSRSPDRCRVPPRRRCGAAASRSWIFSFKRCGPRAAREGHDARPVPAARAFHLVRRSPIRVARSSGETLAEVSASIATATLVSYTMMRGLLSARTMQTNVPAFSTSASRRPDSRHSHAAQPSGNSSEQQYPRMIEAHARTSSPHRPRLHASARAALAPSRAGSGRTCSHSASSPSAPSQGQPRPQIASTDSRIACKSRNARVRVRGRRPLRFPQLRQRQRVKILAIARHHLHAARRAGKEIRACGRAS